MAKRTENRHHRELIELAVLFGTAGLADLFAALLGHHREGPSILMGVGIVLALGTVGHHLWLRYGVRRTRRGDSDREGDAPTPTPTPATAPSTQLAIDAAPTGRLWRVRTVVEDTPGRLAVIAGALAGVGANILATQVHPSGPGVVDEFLVETPETVGADRLVDALAAAGGGEPQATPADIHALVDAPVRALELARRLARDPDRLSDVIRDLLGATGAETESAPDDYADASDGIDDADGTVMRLRLRGADLLVVTRPSVPFTPTEYARARAMADLAASMRPSATGAARA